ncbi:reverse transcriptase domain-containing protein [Tanacetum coccineum]|uniref:Reverse transcriptase domain-containing protein n=1 Tax=Tanacetum coccineum TaxID=301880 RepID=A0ABQ5I5Y9_9ASTR
MSLNTIMQMEKKDHVDTHSEAVMTVSGFGKDEILRTLAWRPIEVATMASVWNAENLQCLQTLTGNTSIVTSILCWDQFLLSCSLDKTIKVYRVKLWKDIKNAPEHYMTRLKEVLDPLLTSKDATNEVKVPVQTLLIFAELFSSSKKTEPENVSLDQLFSMDTAISKMRKLIKEVKKVPKNKSESKKPREEALQDCNHDSFGAFPSFETKRRLEIRSHVERKLGFLRGVGSVLVLPSNWFPLTRVKWLPLIANSLAVSYYAKESPIPPPTIVPPSSMFNPQEFFLPEELLSPKKQGHNQSFSSTSALPQEIEMGESTQCSQRMSTSKAPAITQAAIKKLVTDCVTAALEAQACIQWPSTCNPNKNTDLLELLCKNRKLIKSSEAA